MSDVFIYPNPTEDLIFVKAPKGAYECLEIINNLGQVLLQQDVVGTETELSTGSLSSGIYYILLKGTNGTGVEKIEKR